MTNIETESLSYKFGVKPHGNAFNNTLPHIAIFYNEFAVFLDYCEENGLNSPLLESIREKWGLIDPSVVGIGSFLCDGSRILPLGPEPVRFTQETVVIHNGLKYRPAMRGQTLIVRTAVTSDYVSTIPVESFEIADGLPWFCQIELTCHLPGMLISHMPWGWRVKNGYQEQEIEMEAQDCKILAETLLMGKCFYSHMPE